MLYTHAKRREKEKQGEYKKQNQNKRKTTTGTAKWKKDNQWKQKLIPRKYINNIWNVASINNGKAREEYIPYEIHIILRMDVCARMRMRMHTFRNNHINNEAAWWHIYTNQQRCTAHTNLNGTYVISSEQSTELSLKYDVWNCVNEKEEIVLYDNDTGHASCIKAHTCTIYIEKRIPIHTEVRTSYTHSHSLALTLALSQIHRNEYTLGKL